MYFTLDLKETIYKQIKKTYYMSASFAGRHVVGFGDLNINVFLEVQNRMRPTKGDRYQVWYRISTMAYRYQRNG